MQANAADTTPDAYAEALADLALAAELQRELTEVALLTEALQWN